jgi:hypothetical protein
MLPALKGSSTADDAGVQWNCSFKADLAVRDETAACLHNVYGLIYISRV